MQTQVISEVLAQLYPGKGFSFKGDDLSTLVCEDKTVKISIDDLKKKVAAAQAVYVPPLSLQDQINALQAQLGTVQQTLKVTSAPAPAI